MSSASRNRTKRLVGAIARTPVFRALAIPRFGPWNSRTLPSRAAIDRTIVADLSVLPSSTTMTSRSPSWDRALSTASSRKRSPLKHGTMIETSTPTLGDCTQRSRAESLVVASVFPPHRQRCSVPPGES